MLFHSWNFAVFLGLFLPLYYLTRGRVQDLLLLVAGYVFYGAWDPRFCLLLGLSTTIDYLATRGIARGGPHRRLWLILSLVQNLGILAFFKYYDFFAESLTALFSSAGWNADLPTLRLILPVGISFITFQSIAYVVDVYLGRVEAERDFARMAIFVSFFPQLVAGPIERAGELLPQLRGRRRVTQEAFSAGCVLFLLGLFKKLAIADVAAVGVDEAFQDASRASWPVLWKGAWLFAIQIYGDFSGYSDMARGVGRLLGVEMVENFRQPYLATSLQDFWRRWHMSLSRWLRDYVYIPLGGSRDGAWRTDRNLMLTMVLGGFWHGASWTFVAWGALHGVFLVLERRWRTWRMEGGGPDVVMFTVFRAALGMILTFHLVMFTWIFFRATSIASAWEYLSGLLTLRGGIRAFRVEHLASVVVPLTLMASVDLSARWSREELLVLRWSWPLRGLTYAALILGMILLGPNRDLPFLYFQF